jgi:uncharacterized DUF497 family protein
MFRFEWDTAKAAQNVRKHGISFETAVQVFADPHHVSDQDRIEGGEYRWQTIGWVQGLALLLVAHSWTDSDGVEVIRIISARRADRREKVKYERENR